MEQEQRKKPGPAPKPKIDNQELLNRIKQLQSIIIEIGTHTGYAAILRKHGLSAYKPTKKDMSRHG